MEHEDALVRRADTGESLQQAVFPAAWGTDDEGDLVGWSGEADAVEDGAGVTIFGRELTREIECFQHGRRVNLDG